MEESSALENACREKDAVISTLEREVAEQKELRARDARQVETKAQRIKEWVAHKLRELELQNAHLQEQNQKCNEQLELLKSRLLQLSQLSLADQRPLDEDEAPPAYSAVDFSRKTSASNPPRHPPGVRLERKRYREVSVASSSDMESLQAEDSHKLEFPTRKVPPDEDLHDYAEIYTPSKEVAEFTLTERPPTPPLHRFPSWESRIYEVATNGISRSFTPVPSGKNTIICEAGADNHICGLPGSSGISTLESRTNGGAFTQLNVPVYAAIKGRASQIRSVPFTGDSSDSSDNEENTRATTSGADTESTLSTYSPRGTCSPIKYRDTSAESVLSEDYAVPPDAISTDAISTDSLDPLVECSPRKESLEKSGYLTKLGGKLKTWKRRWFVLKNGALRYYKSQCDVNRKPQGQIALDQVCRVTRAEGATTFEIATEKRSFYLTADSASAMEEWVKVLQSVLRRNATRLLLSREDHKPAIEGWLTKVKHGHPRRVWCVLIGRLLLYFKTASDTTPMGQINMRDAHVEEVVHMSDSDEEGEEGGCSQFTIGIFPPHQSPTYLLMANKQELDTWLYHFTVVSSGENIAGTSYEQLISKLMEVDGDEGSVIWKHPLLLYSKESISQPLTTLPSEALQTEAVKLFKSIQLFISVPLDASGIDYHVALAQNALAQCLGSPELQNELVCQLIKQTSRHSQQKVGVQQLLLCATQSLFLCDTSSSSSTDKGSPTSSCPPEKTPCPESKLNPPQFVFIQGWQLLALTVSLFVPRKRTLWYLRKHLRRNAHVRTEPGKYSIFCLRALERALSNGERACKPSRMEVLSILLKNPFHHSNPHSIPVHFLNGTYLVVGFDGSTTVEEFIQTLNTEAGIRDTSQSGFALYSDDPIDKTVEHCLNHSTKKPESLLSEEPFLHCSIKLCDIISRWEQALREKQLGKFENTRVIKLTYKNRLCFHQMLKAETDKERLLTAYYINEEVIQGKFPLTKNLSLELAALMAQIEFGDYNGGRASGTPKLDPLQQLQQVVDSFFPRQFVKPNQEKWTMEAIRDKWETLKGRSVQDCVRIYLNCVRKWSYCGAKLFHAKLKTKDQQPVWLAVTEDGVSLLSSVNMQPWTTYPYSCIMTFGGCRDDLMLVVCPKDADACTEKLLFAMAKPKILELTLLIADYMNALKTATPASPLTGTLSRLEHTRAKVRSTDTSRRSEFGSS
ncbi:uncharacterized protein CG43867-like isoform X2 [Ornithodoros turicata]|uniref:uncharacterized protein CG43867-like isoform X2 n=1 Tax=Ornithodoros turicata TaxID=34597 RepID=UPI00313A1E16